MRIENVNIAARPSRAEEAAAILLAAVERQREIDKLVSGLFGGVAEAAAQATRPLSYWSNLARENARNPAPTPVDFWDRQEAARQQRALASSRMATSPLFGVKPLTATPAAVTGVNAGLSPVEFARGERQSDLQAPKIGLPPAPPIRQIRLEDIFQVRSEVVAPIGRIVDVFA